MILLTNDEIDRLLSMDMCLHSLERAYKDLAYGKAINRPRTDLYLPDTTPNGVYCFKSMEAGLVNEKVVAIRLNSDVIRWEERSGGIIKDKVPVAPGNKWVGLILLFSAETGEPLAVFPDGIIQGLRVAASSGLAARFLSRTDSTILGILGSGWQARAHARAMCSVRSIQKIRVYSPTKVNRETFGHEMEKELRIPVESFGSAEDVADSADILVAATNSVSRVVPPKWLKPGMHVTCVKITELGEETIGKADRLVIHTRKFAPENYIAGLGDEKIEAHDPIEFLKGNREAATVQTPFWIGATELKDVVASKALGRQSAEEITCFNNNIGLGIQFAALAKVVYEQAKSKQIGREIPTDWFLETVHP
jgi:ornithine cyclodeaminase/alanine dehydrogenase-like protein (mu-crystallin family)